MNYVSKPTSSHMNAQHHPRMKHCQHKGKNGFTLLEVIIAIAIFSVISLTGFTLFDTVLKSDEFSKSKNSRLNELQRAFLIIERDIVQMARRTVRFEGEAPSSSFIRTGGTYDGDDILLSFTRQGWKNPALMLPRSDLQLVLYKLNENKFERLHFNYVDVSVGNSAKVRTLITDVKEVKFEYYDGKAWLEEYDHELLPLAVAIIVTLEDYGEIRRQFLVPGELTASKKL